MANNNWDSVDFCKARGMATNVVNSGPNYARKIQNLHAHVKKGALVTRPQYDLKYVAPEHSTIINQGILGFKNFYDKQAVSTGKEVSCLIHGAEIQAIDDGAGSPIVEDVVSGVCFWARPYWSASLQQWVDSDWDWLNKIIITKVTLGSNSTYKYIRVWGNSSNGLGDDSVDGWTIINKTQNQIAQVITSKKHTTNETRICHTLYNSDWDIDDVIIFMREYIPLDYLEGMLSADWRDLSFHHVLHDLRIGFGGYENRLGIGVGFRDKYFKMAEFDFPYVYSDLTASALTAFSKIEGLTLNPYSFVLTDAYGLDLVAVSGSLALGTYYFKLTGILDGYAEALLTEAELSVNGTKDIEIYPYLVLGRHNKRITGFRVYRATSKDGIFYHVNTYTISSDTANASEWKIDEDGRLYLVEAIPEIHTESNAASIASDTNSIGSWEAFPNAWGTSDISSDTPGSASTYYLRTGGVNFINAVAFPIGGLKQDTLYTITFYAKVELAGGSTLYVFFSGDLNIINLQPQTTQAITNGWVEYTLSVDTGHSYDLPTKLVFYNNTSSVGNYDLLLDDVSIKESEGSKLTPSTTIGASINSILGYTPSYNLVKSWDQCLCLNNKCHYLNPYIEKRYENWIMKSIISGLKGKMYDIATTASNNELDIFEGDKTIAISPLTNGNLLIHQNVSAIIFDPDNNLPLKEFSGKGCCSKWGIVNINEKIYWPSLEDVHAYNNGIVDDLIDDIRDLYDAIVGKNGIVAVRDKYNTYRFRIYETEEKTEYLFANNEWIQEKKNVFPFLYTTGFDYQLWFVDMEGNVYTQRGTVDYSPMEEILMEETFVVEDS